MGIPVANWQPARKFPESYPGTCPGGHYLLCGDEVLPLAGSLAGDGYDVVHGPAEREPVDSFLRGMGAALLDERYPVLAYGANRNPATLHAKFRNYGPGPSCVPVLTGSLRDADVVACRLHGQGYFYGELLLRSALVAETELEIRVGLVDLAQLRALNDSEGLRTGMYTAARVPGVRVSGLPVPITPMAYVTDAPVWASPRFGTPVAFSVVPATGRSLPAMNSRELMNHVLDEAALRPAVAAVTGLACDDTLAPELAKYLNGQWWYHFHTGDAPIRGHSRVLELFNSAMAKNTIDSHTRQTLAAGGMLLGAGPAYDPPASLRLAAMR